MQDRSIIDANKQIIQERNREEKGTEERWCDMARNCSSTPGLTCFLCFCARCHQTYRAYCKLHFSSNLTLKVSINRDDCIERALLQKHLAYSTFASKASCMHWDHFEEKGAKGKGSSSPHAKLSPELNPISAIHLTYIFIQPQSILLHIPKC